MGIGDILRAGKAGAEVVAKSLSGSRKEPDLVEVKALVNQYSDAWWAEREAKSRKEEAKKKILELYEDSGVDEFEGDEGVVRVSIRKDSVGLIMKAVKEVLTEEQIEKCSGVTREGGVTVTFSPTVRRSDGE